jgi:hypothetical protein
MDVAIVPALTALTVLVLRVIAIAELFVRLRWQLRLQREHRYCLVALARTLPRGSRLDEIRPDGSELHLVIAHVVELTERPPR